MSRKVQKRSRFRTCSAAAVVVVLFSAVLAVGQVVGGESGSAAGIIKAAGLRGGLVVLIGFGEEKTAQGGGVFV